MLTYEDVIGLCDLTDDEVRAIAQHEHIPDIVAAELGNYLVHTEDGLARLKMMIVDDIAEAKRTNNHRDLMRYKAVLLHFTENHP